MFIPQHNIKLVPLTPDELDHDHDRAERLVPFEISQRGVLLVVELVVMLFMVRVLRVMEGRLVVVVGMREGELRDLRRRRVMRMRMIHIVGSGG
jgi:hypothetical protein